MCYFLSVFYIRELAYASEQGRLTYSSGDTEGALRYFISLLRGSRYNTGEYDLTDSVYIGDFKVAFEVGTCYSL